MRTLRLLPILISCLLAATNIVAQNIAGDSIQSADPASEVAKATDLSIPVSPALTLLGVNPSLVARPSSTRNLKVDWSFTSYRISPNLALEAQPIWLLLYDRPDLSKYRKAGALMRTLSTLSISLATIQRGVDDSRQLSAAAKLNLYRAKDPLMEVEQFKRSYADFYQKQAQLLREQNYWRDSLRYKTDAVDKLNAQDQIDRLESELFKLKAQQRERNMEIKAQYQRAYWNASCLDIAFGKIYNFANVKLDSLALRENGFGTWINGGIRVGRNGFFSSQVQYLEQETFNENNISQGYRSVVSMGINFRYGSPRYNFFIETVYDRIFRNNTQNTVITFAYGGDLRLGNSALLTFGIRNIINRDFSLKNLIPVASVTCLMR